jgi:hypothetical protein
LIRTCANCGKYNFRNRDPDGFCEHSNIKQIFRKEKSEECPFWVPMAKIDKIRIKDIVRKIKNHKGFKD